MTSISNEVAARDEITQDIPVTIELAQVPQPIKNDESNDPFLVDFTQPIDTSNPKDWPTSRKWAVTDVVSATGFNRIMVSTIMAPALSTISHELHMNSPQAVMALSIYLLATAFGPLLIGPLSEVYGRKRILHASNVWFLVWNVLCGFARTKEVLIASRFLAGLGASGAYALAGGVLGDVWRPEQRGRSLGVYLLIPLLGAAVGPIIGGFMAGRTTWRWMFWSTSIFQASMMLVSFTAFRETHAVHILKRRAEKLRRKTGDMQYYTLQERMDSQTSLLSILTKALTRPLRLLLFHPIIQITSLVSAFYYGVLYIVLSSFADLWTQHYHFSVELSGLHYIACAAGEVAGSQLGGPLMDAFYRRTKARHPDREHLEPEHRIPLTFPGAFIAPLGLFLYGWTAHHRTHWIAVDAGIFLTTFGMQIRSMALQAYVIDAYPEHTSSAMAATQFASSLTAFLFPLFAPTMYNAMGYGWGNTMLGLMGLGLGVPVTGVLWVWGRGLRVRGGLTD
ncbi:MFS general substrate transporter [Westerdykella ornata]|uniref:MFS general substrate transporter n=1 Tax=Westerdykella ornata TaxID=318751 RepID=A0A6A6J898_WESOR|nr:MFS general substrate transporter [Westerdykella ornata]KAF2272228.1 MFS general substrate transporter [Westerdykella ornata]